MQLKRIKLAGFKSFVDPTEIPIRGQISAIVGPNGCGKSNVVDAIRWVIGEMSAKHLRGDSMSDVIFNGTALRKPIGKASVELLFDNTDGKIGGEYAKYAELSVRRELLRDEQSNYFINAGNARRRDVVDLFLGTGLGPRSYAIIEQGMVSQLIEAKPEDLRFYIEEAAGISKYKERRRETETRMRHTQENLDRLNDIREELGNQLTHLKRQANAAERYRVLKQEERSLNAKIKALQWKAFNLQLTEQDQQLNQQQLLWEEKQSHIRQVETEIEKNRSDLITAEDARNQVQKSYYGLTAEIARLEQQIKDNQEQIKQWQSELNNIEAVWQELQSNVIDCQQQIDSHSADILRLTPKISEVQSLSADTEKALADAEKNMALWQEVWDAFQAETSEAMSLRQVTKTKVEHYAEQVQQFAKRLQEQQQQYQQLQPEQLQNEISPLLLHAEALNQKIEETKAALARYAADLVTVRQANAKLSDELQQERQACQKIEASVTSLLALQQAALGAGDDSSVKWLNEQGLSEPLRLGQHLQVAPGWEQAVEAVLNAYFDVICVDQISDWIDRLVRLPSGQLTIVGKSEVTSEVIMSADRLASKVSCDWPLQQWLAPIFVTETLEEAIQKRASLGDHESIVTRNGIWLGKDWMQVFNVEDVENNFLLRQQRLKQLQKDVELKQDALAKKVAQLKAGEQHLQNLEVERDALHRNYQSLTTEVTQVQTKLSAKKTRLIDVERQAKRLQDSLQASEAQLKNNEILLAEAESKLQGLIASQEIEAGKRVALQKDRDSRRDILKEAQEAHHQARKAADELKIRLNASQDQRTLLQQTILRDQRQIVQLEERRQRLSMQLSVEDSPIEGYQQELQIKLKEQLVLQTQLTAAETALEHATQKRRELEQLRGAYHKALQEMQTQLENLRMQRQTIAVRQMTTQEQLHEADLVLETILAELSPDDTIEKCQADLDKVSQRLQRLGAINLAAIEEYDSVNERKTYLDQQHADLVEALNLLQDAIRKIDRETRIKFKDTYDRLNQHFQALFPRVFGGGHASLELTDEDLLVGGIIVRANPPGKRHVTIHMLSGGEKALTAMALIFGLFQLNPAPFCILDEVDAPLDENNVNRFCHLVKEMSKQVQFLIISHNKVTIEMADHLMGVTMQEPGVSRLVSVDVQQAVAMVEAI